MVVGIVIILHLLERVPLTLFIICLGIMIRILKSLPLLPITNIHHIISVLVDAKTLFLVLHKFTVVNIVLWLPLQT